MSQKKNYAISIFSLVLALGIGITVSSFDFHYIESLSYDARFRARPFSEKPNDLIKTIAVDKKAFEAKETGINAHIQLLKTLLAESPEFLIYTFPISEIPGTPDQKAELASLASKFKNFLVVYDDVIIKGQENLLILPEPYSKISYVPGVITYDKNNFAGDEVSRRALIYYQDQLLLQPYVASFYNGITDPTKYRGSFEFREALQTNINYQKPGTFKESSIVDINKGSFVKNSFNNKIVLIGYDDQFTPNYYIKTPYTRDLLGMTKLEAHAHVLKTFIENNGIIKTPVALNQAITVLFTIVVTFAVFMLTPAVGIITIFALLAGYSLFAALLFMVAGVAIGMAQPLVAIFVCYYFFIPYRLIRENKKFWELREKNKLLTQVEELKNNFLSMMSHDLKTPLARIQGMADIALAKPDNLAPEQKGAVQTIRKSAEELTEFISSILDLSRVESQKIKLNLQSRDINRILEETIKKYEYLAQQKNIEIIPELDTLFSVKIDADLMKQVFSNLIENAVKYSPTNSKILVTTEEVDGNIIVQVADQGIGITENEIKHIFTKFYRTKHVKNSPIKGSGLGLYLAKYFVELHKGQITVESQPQQGSTFTVNLPMEQHKGMNQSGGL
jgi:signal transduction histidine kinase